MLYSLKGILTYAEPAMAVVECSGVGFRCQITLTTYRALPQIGEEVKIYTHMNVREDAISLFGFLTNEEMNCFKLLITVSGVGPKVALAVLSELSPDNFAIAVATGDYSQIKKAQGVGLKTSQRIILELRDKMGGDKNAGIFEDPGNIPVNAGNASEAVSALMVLGFPTSIASRAVAGIDSSLPAGEIIKLALKSLSKG